MKRILKRAVAELLRAILFCVVFFAAQHCTSDKPASPPTSETMVWPA